MTPVPRDTFWQPAPSAAGRYRPWLTDRGSLTARIEARCPGVRVQVVFQGLRRPDRDERFVFAHRGRARVLVREAFLYCGDAPVVFAHTVLDPEHLDGVWRSVAKLGNRPLGAALFADAHHALRAPPEKNRPAPRVAQAPHERSPGRAAVAVGPSLPIPAA